MWTDPTEINYTSHRYTHTQQASKSAFSALVSISIGECVLDKM